MLRFSLRVVFDAYRDDECSWACPRPLDSRSRMADRTATRRDQLSEGRDYQAVHTTRVHAGVFPVRPKSHAGVLDQQIHPRDQVLYCPSADR